TKITGEHVSIVGDGAFSGCTALRSAIFQPLAQIGESAFRDCEALRTLENGLAETLTEIPAGAFRGCAVLTDLSMPSVTQIGDCACADCRKLRFRSDDVWGKLESIGAHAFEHAGLTGTVRLTSLRSLGVYAFAENEIAEIDFPDTLTVLPEGVCRENPKLRKLTAAGVLLLEPYALQQTAAVPATLNMDFSRITSLGCAALEGVRFSGPVVFSGLRSVEDGALDGIQGPGFWFPSVRSLGAGAVHHAENAVLYFENLVTMHTDAVKRVRALVVGDHLETAEPGSASADILAGPSGSPLEQYAEQAHLNFKATPYLLTNQKNRNVSTGEAVQLQALPLGFGDLHVRWTDENGKMLPDGGTGILQAEWDSAGERICRAALYQGDTEVAFAEFHERVAENTASATTEIRTDELYIADLRSAIAAGTAVSNDGVNYHVTYRFRAEEDGTYRLLLTGSCNYMNITDAEGEPVPFERDTGASGQNAVFIAKKGNSFLIDLAMQYSLYQGNAPVCSLRLTNRELSELTSLTDSGIELLKSDLSEYIWQGEPVIPEKNVLRLSSADTDLTENADYIVYCIDNNAVGSAVCWIFGIGDYCGAVNYAYQIIGVVQEGKPLKTGSAPYGQYYDFTPEEDGDYLIFPDYSDAWIAEQQAKNCFEVQYWHNNDMISVFPLYPDETGSMAERENSSGSFTENYTYPLKKGMKYRIVFTRSPSATQPELCICPERGKRRIEDYIFYFEGEPEYVQLSSEPFERHIICEPVFDGPELTEGKDYTVTYIANDRAGETAAIIRGIGGLRGTSFVSCRLVGQLKQSGHADVHLNDEYACVDYRFVPETSGTYVFYTDYPAKMLAEADRTGRYDPETLAAEPKTELTILTDEYVRLKYSVQDEPGRFTAIGYELTAGESYIIEASSKGISDFALHAEKAGYSILDAEVLYQKTVGSDEVSTNPVTVTLGETELKA
ncbi:MAG: leucine-rich repeat domain-containing protein, partial [Oscillospiraceae bacterium]|nr:leucine-rich repeat domain-containing protein [Oscillospiraceae bacterium]